ncbi:hypothetical protein TRV_03490 [Trichophyton verrucosum HKI 0517]|uniref:Uncharacterized protein n=1 Tax=Trichophyton verrucosum (strain HKI 0517) TaxID=663202 RepID=D4D8Q3_TRIVH|nr:uncharacterized protein TRV_03490 [Trichophyton verrucosum HKI 0517]EFE41808.1 hypothetical protein TRV_03490 [Trichophyton verrucosum HKI 0517]
MLSWRKEDAGKQSRKARLEGLKEAGKAAGRGGGGRKSDRSVKSWTDGCTRRGRLSSVVVFVLFCCSPAAAAAGGRFCGRASDVTLGTTISVKKDVEVFFFCPLFDLDFFSSSSPAGQTSHPARLWSTVSFLFSSPVESTAVFFAGDSPDCTAGFITASGGGLLETRDGHAYARERERERGREDRPRGSFPFLQLRSKVREAEKKFLLAYPYTYGTNIRLWNHVEEKAVFLAVTSDVELALGLGYRLRIRESRDREDRIATQQERTS